MGHFRNVYMGVLAFGIVWGTLHICDKKTAYTIDREFSSVFN